MPEPLKNLFNHQLIHDVARHLARVWPEIDQAGFITAASQDLDELELKQRSQQIERALERFLPKDFGQAAAILRETLAPIQDGSGEITSTTDGIAGWAIMPVSTFVGRQGAAHLDLALDLMRDLTKRFSAEFGIRYLILAEPERCLSRFPDWVDDPSQHVRRLVSEGTRPRLPWAPRLPMFISDPAPLLPLLTALRDDPEEYVRRSVANSLNDIAKDHPDLVAGLAKDWLADAPAPRRRLIRQACRTLVKRGHPAALAALGYDAARLKETRLSVATPQVTLGSVLEFELSLTSTSDAPQDLVIDYIVHHRKANGTLSPKVFKWKTIRLGAGDRAALRRRHAMRKVTTRVYYPGTHGLDIQVNGATVASSVFDLIMRQYRS